jgi:uncharacterized protein (TIGR00251 family)
VLNIREVPGGLTFEVKVTPGMSNNEISGVQNGALKVKINAAPEKGKANKELIGFLSGTLGIRKADIEVIKGVLSRNKSVRVGNIGRPELISRLGLRPGV